MNKHNKLSLRDRILRANSQEEFENIWKEVEQARAHNMTAKTYRRCEKAAVARVAFLLALEAAAIA